MENSNIADNVITITPSLASLRFVRDEAATNLNTLSEVYNAKRAELTQQILDLEAVFEKENAELIELCDRAKEIAEKTDRDLRAAVIGEHIRTGEKTIDKALKLSVRVNRKVSIADQKAALTWAKVAMPALVVEQVDEKKFSKIADTLWGEDDLPDWVKVEAKPIAVIGELV